MPAYDYHCPTNGQTVEVRHQMTAMLTSWKDLCDAGGLDLGDTPADAPVKRLFNAPMVATGAEEAADVCMDNPAVSRGGCAHGAACGCF